MIKTDLKLEYCMECGEPNPPDQEICKCGSRNFVFGNDFKYENGKAICDCGNDKFSMIFHMNANPYYTKNFKCSNCGNLIATQTYYESPYL